MKTFRQFLGESEDPHARLTSQGYKLSVSGGGNRTYTRYHKVNDDETHQLDVHLRGGKIATQTHRLASGRGVSRSAQPVDHRDLSSAIQHNIDYANRNPRKP